MSLGRSLIQWLQHIFEPKKPTLTLLRGGAEQVESSLPESPKGTSTILGSFNLDSPDDENLGHEDFLKPVIATAAKMLTLNHKPYLTAEEVMFYLNLNENELDEFMARHQIQKFYLTGNSGNWFVRREAVENVS